MKILVAGASGATGRHVVDQLLQQNHQVRAIVRSPANLPQLWHENQQLELIEGAILDLSDRELRRYTRDCQAVVSCLGHNLTWQGVFGHPRRLVTEAVRRLCKAIEANRPGEPVRFVLMNTTGNRNRDLMEPISCLQKIVIWLLRVFLPPHADNEQAAEYLRSEIGQRHPFIEWVAVRPDGLVNENVVSNYEIHPSPTRSAIFNAGRVSRINVAHFMAALASTTELWENWKGQMPVIYSASVNSSTLPNKA